MLIKKFEEQVRKRPEKAAVISENRSLTYRDLSEKGNRVAAKILMGNTIAKTPGKRVIGLLFEHGVDMIIGVISVLKSDSIYLPLDNTYPGNRLKYMLKDSKTGLILTNKKNKPLALSLVSQLEENIEVMDITAIGKKENHESPEIERNPDGDRQAYILYTSGSTGKPKGVCQSQRNVSYYVRNWIERFSITEKDRMTLFSAFSHDGAGQDIFGALHSGATLYPFSIMNRENLVDLPLWLIQEEITIWHSVPTLYRYFMNTLKEDPNRDFPHLRYVLLGGEQIREHDIREFQESFPDTKLANVYGQTESSVNSIWIIEPKDPVNKIKIGEPLDETTLLVVDEEDEIIEDMGVGEIMVASEYLALGYWEDKEVTETVFTHDPEIGKLYFTGDLGRLMADGTIEFLGRKDTQVKIRGFRVEVGEIESHLLKHPLIRETIVIPRENSNGEHQLCAYYVTHPHQDQEELTVSQLNQYLSKELPLYMVPTSFVELEEFPLTPNGKINRRKLPVPDELRPKLGTDFEEPGTETEKRIAGIWKDVLELDRVGIHDNFFQLGGDSLKGIIVVTRIHKILGVKAPLTIIFNTPTVKGLAGIIQQMEEETHHSIPEVSPKPWYVLSSAQKRIYLIQQLEEVGTAYNMTIGMRIQGPLDKQKFEQIFQTLVERHESLRTSFHIKEGEPVQIIEEKVDFKIEKITQENTFVRTFKLKQAPLLRVGLIQKSEENHILLFDTHHIVSDGMSLDILTHEFTELYEGKELPVLRIQYKDYAEWQHQRFQDNIMDDQKKFWKTHLEGELPVLQMPLDEKPPEKQTFTGEKEYFEISPGTRSQLNRLAKENETTLNMIFLGIYYLLLYHYSEQEDIIVGSLVAGRNHADLEKVLGMFGNFLPIRVKIPTDQSYLEFLETSRKIFLSTYENQEYPFEEIINIIKEPLETTRNPLFDTMLIFHNEREPGKTEEVEGLTFTTYELENTTSKLDFKIDIYMGQKGEMKCFLEYNTQLFRQSTIKTMVAKFEQLVQTVIEKPKQKIAETELFTEDERKELVEKREKHNPLPIKPIKIVVSSTFTSEPIEDYIHWWGKDQGIKLEVSFALYNQVFRELLDENSLVSTNRGINLLLIRFEDWIRSIELEEEELIQQLEYNYENLLNVLKEKKKTAPFMVGIFPVNPLSGFETSVVKHLESMVNRWEKDLREFTGIHIVDFTRLKKLYAIKEVFDPVADEQGHLPFTPEYYASMGTYLVRRILEIENQDIREHVKKAGAGIKEGEKQEKYEETEVILHHIAVAVKDIEASRTWYQHQDYQCGEIIFDPLQKSFLCMCEKPGCDSIELVSSKDQQSPTWEITRKNGDIPYHFCYRVRNVEHFLENLREKQIDYEIAEELKPAVLFEGQRVMFLQITHVGLVELLEDRNGDYRIYPDRAHYLNTVKMVINQPTTAVTFFQHLGYRKVKIINQATKTIIYMEKANSGIMELIVPRARNQEEKEFFNKNGAHIYRLGLDKSIVQNTQTMPQYLEYEESVQEKFPIKKTPSGKTFTSLLENITANQLMELPIYELAERGELEERGKTRAKYEEPGTPTETKLVEIWEKVLRIEKIGIQDTFFELGGNSLKAVTMISEIHKAFQKELELKDIFDQKTIKNLAKLITASDERAYTSIPAAEKKEYYPVSSAQQRLCIINELEGITRTYNIYNAIFIKGNLDRDRFGKAFQNLVHRHESLRTTFEFKEGGYCQKVHPEVEFQVDYVEKKEAELEEWLNDFIRPFDFKKAPLIRVGLASLKREKHLMVYDMHHVVSDGMSMAILVREFVQLYQGERIPELKVQYKEFSQWQNHLFQSEEIHKQRDYWIHHLSGQLPGLNMPLDYKRPRKRTFEGNTYTLLIPSEIVVKLDQLARQKNVTLNALVFTLYTLLVSQYSNQEDVVIGSLVAGRRHAELEQVIGMFGNFLPIRNNVRRDQTFAEYLSNSQKAIMESYENQDYPFERMVNDINYKASEGRNPLFDTMLIFHNEVDTSVNFTMEELQFAKYPFLNKTSKLDFKVDATFGNKGELNCIWEYNTSLFQEKSIQEYSNKFIQLIQSIIQTPDKKISELQLFYAEEQKILEKKRERNLRITRAYKELVVCSTFTSEPMGDYIRWWGQEFDLEIGVEFAPYHQEFQQLLDPHSQISTHTGINLLLIRFEDWIRGEEGSSAGKIAIIQKNYQDLISILKNKEKQADYMVGILPPSPQLEQEVQKEIQQLYKSWKKELEALNKVYVLDLTTLEYQYQVQQVWDDVADREGHVPYTMEYYAAMGTRVARNIVALNNKQPFKVIALDCDNTLWKGICGEDGVMGVKVTPPFQKLQKLMLEKFHQGFLLVLNSKNNEKDVWEVFEKNPGMLLKKEHILHWKINWQPKSQNLKQMAEELNLGIDSMIFLDDNPVECSEVMTHTPQVLSLQLPKEPDCIPIFLEHIWAFDKLKVTEEDRKRTQMYRSEQTRKQTQQQSLTLDDFLGGLELKISMNIIETLQVSRVSQLTQRTNQFNLSTIRRSEDEIKALANEPGTECWVLEVKDRFGDYGLVGVVITREQEKELFVDTLLLSCRVLGRGVEECIMAGLRQHCEHTGLESIKTYYYPTPKNTPILEYLNKKWQTLSKEGKDYQEFIYPLKEKRESIDYLEFYYKTPIGKKTENSDEGKESTQQEELETTEIKPLSENTAKWEIKTVNTDKLRHRKQWIPLQHFTADHLMNLPIYEIAEQSTRKAYEAPGNELEKQLTRIWEKVLRTEKIGIDDAFFELGGNSLKAVTLISEIHKVFQKELTLKDVFDQKTVKNLANLIATSDQSTYHTITAVENRDKYPVSSAQQRLCIINELEGINRTYNIYNAIYIDGKLDKKRFNQAFEALIQRHESLRTSFKTNKGHYYQVIHPKTEFRVEYTEKREEHLEAWLNEFIRPFDFRKAPLMRVGLARIKEDRHLLVYDMHHVVSDGMSMVILVKEFVQFYTGEKIPQLKIQYKDFSQWQNRLFQSKQIEKQKAHWTNHLKGELPRLEMPIDFKRPRKRTFKGDTYTSVIPTETVERLDQLAREKNVTLNILMFSLYALLVGLYSDQEDVVVGSLVAGRRHTELEQVIGMFGNFLPVRMTFKKDETFEDFLNTSQRIILESYENQDYPFERIIEDINYKATESRNPLFDTMLIFHNEVDTTVDFSVQGLKFIKYPFVNKTSKLDFKIDATFGVKGELNCIWEYNTQLFKPATIEEYASKWEKLIKKVIQTPATTLTHMEVFTPEEQKNLEQKRKLNQKKILPQKRLVVSGSFTSEPMEDYIRWWGKEYDLEIGVEFAPYHQEFQQLLDPHSQISTNTGINLLLIRFEDWIRGEEGSSAGKIAIIQKNYQDLISILKNKEKQADYMVGILPPSPQLEQEVQKEIQQHYKTWKKEMGEMNKVYIADFTHLDEDYQITELYDEVADKEGHIPYTMEFYAAMGTQVARNLVALNNKQPLKLLKPLENYTAKRLLELPIYEMAKEEINHTQYEAPRNKREEQLIEIWQKVLRTEKIGINDTFFALGGNSLKAVTLVSEIHKTFQKELTLKEIFDHKTVKKLSKVIEGTEKSQYNTIEIVEKKEFYPVSSAQRRLYILQQMEPSNIGYNIVIAVELGGKVELLRLEKTFKELIDRHESLRTSFQMVNSEPVQQVQKEIEFGISFFSQATMGHQEHQSILKAFIRPFDLANAPLIRVGLVEIGDQKNILIVDVHHIVSDGISHTLLIQEFLSIYEGETLPPLEVRYTDYSDRQAHDKNRSANEKEYWLTQFEEEPPVLVLPYDFERPTVQAFEGEVIRFDISEEETDQLKQLAQHQGVTLYMVILVVYNILLYRISNQEDMVIGTPIAGRKHVKLERVIGVFINTLALRNKPEPIKTIHTFLEEIKENTLMAFENQDYQFEDLVDQVVKSRDLGRNPLFDVMFIYQNMENMDVNLNSKGTGLTLRPYKREAAISRFDMTLTGMETGKGEEGDRLVFTIEYCTKLFKKKTIEKFIGYIRRIITAVVTNIITTISGIDILSDREKRQLIFDFNDTEKSYPTTITLHQLLGEQTRKTPDKTAIIYRDKKNTYKEMENRASHVSVILRDKRIQPGDIVGLMMERSMEIMEGLFGILKAGAAYLPIGPEYPAERIDYMLQHSNAEVVLTNYEINNAESHHTYIQIKALFNQEAQGPVKQIKSFSHDLVYVIYTSGTTGVPKGVMIEHRSVVNFIDGIVSIIPFREGDAILSLTTLSFDIFGLETILPLTRGSATIIGTVEEQVSSKASDQLLVREKVTIFQVTPSRLKLFFVNQENRPGLKNLHYLLVGGEPFPPDLLQKAKAACTGKIYNMYGPTETTIWSCVKNVSGEENLNIGKPIANTQVYIVGRDQILQPMGVPGELCIGGDGLARGYFKDETLTQQKFVENPWEKSSGMYRTGDLARRLESGEIEYLGRMDHQVKIRGFRIELGEIETQLQQYPDIKETVVISKENEKGDRYLMAFIVAPGKELKVTDMREYLSKVLPDYMIPFQFVQLEKIPLTPNGKINKKQLSQYEGPNLRLGETYVEPGTDKERQLAQLWEEVLNQDKIGANDNFFDLGGNSLNIIQLSVRIAGEMNIDIPVVTLFTYPTIRSFLEYLEQKHSKIGFSHQEKDWFESYSKGKNKLKKRRKRTQIKN